MTTKSKRVFGHGGAMLLGALTATAALVACGGGGGDSTEAAASPASLTLTGTAATGAAIAGAQVALKCATGVGSGTTLSDGTFSINIVGGVLPCAAEVATAGGTKLHSFATGSGATAVLNITPVTELVFASLVGLDPAVFYASFTGSAATVMTPTLVAAAQSAVIAILKAAGIDLSSFGDLLSAALKASTAAAAGDAYDQALDRFGVALASSGTTLTALTTSVIAATNPTPGTADVAALPPALLLQPAAANCSALRSGSYRVLTPLSGTTLSAQFGLISIDAKTLAIVRADASTGSLVANGSCRFTDTGTNYSADIVVSPAGVLLGRYTPNGGTSYHNLFGFPEQPHAVAELAGQWNVFGMDPAGSTHVGVAGMAVLSAAGQMSGVVNCENDSTWAVDTCASVPDSVTGLLGPLVVNAAGGFDLPDAATGLVKTRVFAYANGSGTLMIAGISNVGFSVWSKVVAVVLPTVGTNRTSWNFDINPDLSSNSATYESTNLVDSVDATAGSWTRTHGTIGQSVTRVETVFADKPRTGFTFRPAGTVTASDGKTISVIREFTFLGVTGMGVSIGTLPALKIFEFSAREP